jgi:ceramide glucosyltransferase
MIFSQIAAWFCALMIGLQIASALLAARRCRKPTSLIKASADAPAVTIVQPLCGVDSYSRETLASIFSLDYPDYEIVFCLADGADPVAALASRFISDNPRVPARLLIGDDRPSANPKLNNVVKGWKAARHEWIIIADSNVLMPADYIQRLMTRWRDNSGIVCAPPVGSAPGTFAGEIECAFLNTYQARWQYAGEALGMGFAQGKTMLWRRSVLEDGGGIEALGSEIAEDAAATKLIHRAGLRAHLVDGPFPQPLGSRRWRDVWGRQVRWARLRRATFPLYFAPELVSSGVFPIGAAFLAAPALGLPGPAAAALAALGWYGPEAALALAAGWRLSLWSPLAWIARDLAMPCLWAQAWVSDEFVWRGNAMSVREPEPYQHV